MEVKPYGPEHSSERHESDIFSVSDTRDGLTILIDTKTTSGEQADFRVHFEYSDGYRFLDEGDLLYYWQTEAFSAPVHVFEILSGGWSNGEVREPGVLDIRSGGCVREWFVATTNGCISVLSDSEPIAGYINA